MRPTRNRFLILNYLFIGCLLLLVLNDHLLKSTYGNFLTGKLSDAAGIILLPLLMLYIFPRLGLHVLWLSAAFFVWWKSPLSGALIEAYNSIAPIQITRVVDYSDGWVLLLLPVPAYIISKPDRLQAMAIIRLHPALVLLPCMVAFMATSPPRYYRYNRSEGNLRCYNCYVTIKLSQEEIVQKLKAEHFEFDSIKPFLTMDYQDSVIDHPELRLYKINQLIIDSDTLNNVDITMRTMKPGKTRVYFSGMNVAEVVSDWRLAKKLRKLYRKKLFKELQEKVE